MSIAPQDEEDFGAAGGEAPLFDALSAGSDVTRYRVVHLKSTGEEADLGHVDASVSAVALMRRFFRHMPREDANEPTTFRLIPVTAGGREKRDQARMWNVDPWNAQLQAVREEETARSRTAARKAAAPPTEESEVLRLAREALEQAAEDRRAAREREAALREEIANLHKERAAEREAREASVGEEYKNIYGTARNIQQDLIRDQHEAAKQTRQEIQEGFRDLTGMILANAAADRQRIEAQAAADAARAEARAKEDAERRKHELDMEKLRIEREREARELDYKAREAALERQAQAIRDDAKERESRTELFYLRLNEQQTSLMNTQLQLHEKDADRQRQHSELVLSLVGGKKADLGETLTKWGGVATAVTTAIGIDLKDVFGGIKTLFSGGAAAGGLAQAVVEGLTVVSKEVGATLRESIKAAKTAEVGEEELDGEEIDGEEELDGEAGEEADERPAAPRAEDRPVRTPAARPLPDPAATVPTTPAPAATPVAVPAGPGAAPAPAAAAAPAPKLPLEVLRDGRLGMEKIAHALEANEPSKWAALILEIANKHPKVWEYVGAIGLFAALTEAGLDATAANDAINLIDANGALPASVPRRK